ncbi:MAG: hypothetical protein ACYC7I_00915 [Gammaproteobacteria bacterium]
MWRNDADAFALLLHEEQVLGYQFVGRRYDCGNKFGYLQATVEYALKHAELQTRFWEYLQGFCLPKINGG